MNWLQDELPSFSCPHIAFGVPFSNQLTYQAYQVSLYLSCLCSHKCSENLPVARSCKASTAVKQKDEEEAIGRRCCHCWYTVMFLTDTYSKYIYVHIICILYTHTHIHTHIHTYIYIYIHIYIHIYQYTVHIHIYI